MTKITISYRRDDSMDITGRIFDRLASRYGRETVFRDIDNIPPGLDFREHILASIGDCNVLMVVVGPRWMGGDRHGQPRIHSDTDYVRVEVEAALSRRIPVIPLLVGGADMPEPGDLPESIRNFAYRNAVPIDSGRDFDHHMNGLIRATDKILVPPPGHPGAQTASRTAAEAEGRAAPPALSAVPAESVSRGSSLFLPLIGGVMTVIGLMHLGWFASNLLFAISSGALREMFEGVWSYADIALGLGGAVIGIGTIRGAPWARVSGIMLCLFAVFSNLLWFTDYIDKGLPRVTLIGSGLVVLFAIAGAYLLLFRWPAPADKS